MPASASAISKTLAEKTEAYLIANASISHIKDPGRKTEAYLTSAKAKAIGVLFGKVLCLVFVFFCPQNVT